MLYYNHKTKIKQIGNQDMKKIFNLSLNLLSKAVAAVILSVVCMATGTMSVLGIYEPEMPIALRPKEDEES